VLRLSAAKPLSQWNKNYGDTLDAGQLSGLSAGTVMALYNDAADTDDAAVAYGRIETAGATRSVLAPVAKPCSEGTDCSTAVAEESVFKKARFARIYQQATNFALTLSQPLKLDPNDGHDYSGAIAALKAATEARGLSARVSFRSSGYDLAVGLADGKLVFAPAAGLIDRDGKGSSPRLTLSADPAKAKDEAASALDRMARALALQRLAADPAQAEKLGLKADILVSQYMGEALPTTKCPDNASVYAAPIASGDDPSFGDCDLLSFTMTNNGAKPLDVTILLIGADFSITTVWPQGDLDNRVPIGETKTTEALLQMEPDPAAASEERIIFVAVPGTNKSHTAFNTLDQEGLRGMPGEDAPDVAAARAVLAAALGDMDRAATPTPNDLEEDMTLEVKPFFAGKRGAR
jgi:metacaspase-1